MKSSCPLFTRQNPFQPASRVGKSHYHPSSNQSLSKKKEKDNFESYGQPVFPESWPSTDCGSSPASAATSSDSETPKQTARAGKSTDSSELGVQQDSVLAKYIERFRHGRPQSREERQQMASAIREEQLPFWWMSPSSLPHSSTPTKTAEKGIFSLIIIFELPAPNVR
ncbi:proline and serine-rich protein 3 isoform X1 [Lates japonicus]|uniref:Proline and serine-rich protein 3 isoform X1 n=1 Tax=Lates japonicus TaxID=270547 RepID=A0AAD3RJM5_LATJO|nr:proline and serine-rich protein 3 isoform X1 [Lates japonicus]